MEKPPFFRTDLAGKAVPVSVADVHEILRDCLLYFEINLGEPTNVFVPDALFDRTGVKYAQALSVSFEEEWAESRQYTWLCERGCLAVLNGLALEFLDGPLHPFSDLGKAGQGFAQTCLPYVAAHRPQDAGLEAGRAYLLKALEFLAGLSLSDLDEFGEVQFPITEQGAWFAEHIVADYFRRRSEQTIGAK